MYTLAYKAAFVIYIYTYIILYTLTYNINMY